MEDFGIHSAACSGNLEKLVEILAANRKVVNEINHFGMTPLHGAAFHGQHESVKLLLEYGADVNHPSAGDKYTFPLHLAVSRLHRPVVETLIVDGGADPAAKDYLGHTILDIAQAISVENDSVAKDHDTNIQMLNFIKECIVKAGQIRLARTQKSFIFESKHPKDLRKIKSLYRDNQSDIEDYEEDMKNSIMINTFKSGIL